MTKQLTALEARKWMVENPDGELLDKEGDPWRWSSVEYRFQTWIRANGELMWISGIPDYQDLFRHKETPQRPTHLTLGNVDEWLEKAAHIRLKHLEWGKIHNEYRMTGWTVPGYMLVKTALREGCTIEVIKWRDP